MIWTYWIKRDTELYSLYIYIGTSLWCLVCSDLATVFWSLVGWVDSTSWVLISDKNKYISIGRWLRVLFDPKLGQSGLSFIELMSTHVMPELIEPKWIGITIYNIMEGVTWQILYGSLVPGLSMMEGHGPWLSILECPGPWPSILEKILHIGAIWIRSFHSGESWIGAGQHGRSWNWPPWLLTFADVMVILHTCSCTCCILYCNQIYASSRTIIQFVIYSHWCSNIILYNILTWHLKLIGCHRMFEMLRSPPIASGTLLALRRIL